MPRVLEQDLGLAALRLFEVPDDKGVSGRCYVVLGVSFKSNDIDRARVASSELPDNGWAKLTLVCWRLSGELSQVDDADCLIIGARGNVVGIVLAPVNCVDVICVSLQSSGHWLQSSSSDVPKEDQPINSDRDQLAS